MYVKTNATFVYGRFVWPRKKGGFTPLPHAEDIAVEILREYSSAEFLGKLYARVYSAGDWSPIAPAKVSSYEWYKSFSDAQRPLYFAMEGSGYWQVVNFRNESDEAGPYVAIGLKYPAQSPLPRWVSANSA